VVSTVSKQKVVSTVSKQKVVSTVSKQKVVSTVSKQIVVDGTNLIAGRLCSHVAKLLLQGNIVTIVNSEKIMMSGNKQSIIGEYMKFLEVSSIINPKHGPFHPRRPDRIISRMVRGMLPKKKPSGKAALKHLRAYLGVPKQFKPFKKTQFDDARITRSSAYYTSMGEIGQLTGRTGQ